MIKYYYNLAKKTLYPINRSITGKGVRQTLNIIKKNFPTLKIKKIKSGSKVFDWQIPPEWNVEEAYISDKENKRIIDFRNNNLHLLGYSVPFKKKISKKNLFKNLFYLKKQPNAIPYITSYYKRRCDFVYHLINIKINKVLKDDKFNVVIKSRLNKNGKLNYGELILKGNSKKKF